MGVGAGSSEACPAYPWPHDDGAAQGGRKVFMQSDCAACHTMLPYAAIREAPRGDAQPKLAEIVVAVNEEQAATARSLQRAATPDLTITTKMRDLLRRNNLYTAQELRKKTELLTPVWLQFLRPPSHAV